MADLRALLEAGRPIFGTDGVRGEAGTELTPELALDIGRAAGCLSHGPVVVRTPGAPAHAVGVAAGELPGRRHRHRRRRRAAVRQDLAPHRPVRPHGAVVSVHNPAPDNGIKRWRHGTKLPDEVERRSIRLRSGSGGSSVGGAIGIGLTDDDALYGTSAT